jgi:hypothetical protein
MLGAPENQMCRREANAERNVRRDHTDPGDVAIKARSQTTRDQVIVHHIRRHGRGRRDAGHGAWRSPICGEFEHARPPHRTGVMDRVTQHGMGDVRAVMPHRTFTPRPVTCGVYATGGVSRAGTRMQTNRNGGQYARGRT